MLRKSINNSHNKQHCQKGTSISSTSALDVDAFMQETPPEEREGGRGERGPSMSGGSSPQASFPAGVRASSTISAATASDNKACKDTEIPIGHVETILRVFQNGSPSEPLDLYRDVLNVSPEASERDVRIAYFRRGREVLGEGGFKNTGTDRVPSPTLLDPVTRTKFQAVSMAYEILSTPAWKETYLRNGGFLTSSMVHDNKQLPEQEDPLDDDEKEIFSQLVKPAKLRANVQVPQQPASSSGDDEENEMFTKLVMPSKIRGKVQPANEQPSPSRVENEEARNDSIPQTQPVDAAQIALQTNEPSPIYKKALSKPVSALRQSSFRNGARKSLLASGSSIPRQSSVRWKEQVEELVFDNHPNEHASDDEEDDDDDMSESTEERQQGNQHPQHPTRPGDESATFSSSTPSRKRRKAKRKVVIDSEELESHLKQMDSEAEKHFVRDFWDNFEESMDGILSLVDSLGDSKKKQSSSHGRTGQLARMINRSHSHDSGELETKKNSGNQTPTATPSMLGDEKPFQRSQSFPTRSHAAIPTASKPSSLVQDKPQSGVDSTVIVSFPPSATAQVTPDNSPRHDTTVVSSLGAPAQPTGSNNPWPFYDHEVVEKSQPKLEPEPALVSPVALANPASPSQAPENYFPTEECNSDFAWLPAKPAVTPDSMSPKVLLPLKPSYSETLFRPISPGQSEASEAINSTGNSIRSDQFELESLQMSELENPFRDFSSNNAQSLVPVQPPEIFPQPLPAPDNQSMSSSDLPNDVNASFESNNTKMTENKTKSKRVNGVNMASVGEPLNHEVRDIAAKEASVSNLNQDEAPEEDVFVGLDEPQKQNSVPENKSKIVKEQDMPLHRTSSVAWSDCNSDLSESVFQYGKKGDDTSPNGNLNNLSSNHQTRVRPGAETPASDTSNATTITSNVQSPRSSIRKERSTDSSTRGDPFSAMDLMSDSSIGDGASVHTVETAMEASSFFDYFMAYVSAIVTECNHLGNSGKAFQQDIVGLFSQEASVNIEIREPPARIPTSGSSVTSCSQ